MEIRNLSLSIYDAVDSIADWLVNQGTELPENIKRRDPREPGRAIKERWEDRLYRLMMRRFRIQKRNLVAHLERFRPTKAAADDFMNTLPRSLFDTDDVDAKLLRLFIAASQDGVELFAISSTISLDWTAVNTQAADWAREYTTEWLRGLDDTTRASLRSQMAAFIETPGYTIGDVVRSLPFDEKRALRIATTEITRVFGESVELAGKELQKTFPDVRVVKQWFTNNDSLVCGICAPLNNSIVSISDGFGVVSGEAGLTSPPAHVNCRCWMSSTTEIDIE